MSEGQTATNPQTGERVVMRGGQWVPAGSPAQTPQSRYVAPIIGEPDPFKASSDARSAEELRIRQANEVRDKFDFDKKQAIGPVGDATEGERNNKAFYDRASSALDAYEKLDLGPRTYGGAALEAIPGGDAVLRALPDDVGDSPERRQQQQAMQDFSTAILRSDSGANTPEPEVTRYIGIFFPRPGETDPGTLENYRRARKTALEALKAKAGRLSSGLKDRENEPAIQSVEAGGAEYRKRVMQGAASQPQSLDVVPQGGTQQGLAVPQELQDKLIRHVMENAKTLTPEGLDAYIRDLGREYNYPVNPGNSAEVIKAVQEGRPYNGIEPAREKISQIDQGRNNLIQTPGGTLAANYVNQVAIGIPQALAGQEGYDSMSALSERNPKSAFVGAIAGGVMGAKGIGAGSEATARALGFGPDAASMLANPVTQNALAGGAVGFNTAPEGSGVTNALLGAGTAGGLTKGLQAGSKAWNARPAVIARQEAKAAQQAEGANIAAAGQAEDVMVSRPMVDPKAQNRVTATEATIVGGPVVRSSLRKTASGIEAGLGRLSPGGVARAPEIAGERLQSSISRIDKQGRAKVDKIYEAYRKHSGDPPVTPKLALAEIDDAISSLSPRGNTSSAEIAYLNNLKKDLSGGKMTVQSILDLRTDLRGQLKSQGLDMTQAEARVSRILDAAMKDAESALSVNPGSLALLKHANRAHRERKIFTKSITEQLIGRDPGDLSKAVDPGEAWATINRWAKPGGKTNRLTAMWAKLSPEESADLAATHASILGRGKDGNFSPALLLSQASAIGPRARVAIWGHHGAQSIDNLLTLSRAHNRVFSQLNHSKSGVAATSARDYRSWLAGALGLAGGVGAGSTTTGLLIAGAAAGASAAKDAISARMVMTPSISKWIASAPATATPKAINSHFDRLTGIAAREPAISGEIQTLQQRLMDAAKGMSGPAPAEDKQNAR